MYGFSIFRHGLRAAVNPLRPGHQRLAELTAHASCTNNDAVFTFLLIQFFLYKGEKDFVKKN